MKKQLKTIGATSAVWIILTATVVAFVLTSKSNFERGYQAGVKQTVTTLHIAK